MTLLQKLRDKKLA
jgi:hypothetical protein